MTASETGAGADPGPTLTDEELALMFRLIARYAEHDLDQFAVMQVETGTWGPVFVTIANENTTGTADEVFTKVWPLVGKFAQHLAATEHPIRRPRRWRRGSR